MFSPNFLVALGYIKQSKPLQKNSPKNYFQNSTFKTAALRDIQSTTYRESKAMYCQEGINQKKGPLHNNKAIFSTTQQKAEP